MPSPQIEAAQNIIGRGTVVEVVPVHSDDCVLAILGDGQRVYISNHEFRREMKRITPDPMVEAFTAVAVALHEQEKAR